MKNQQRISYVCGMKMAATVVLFMYAAGTAYATGNIVKAPGIKKEKQKQERPAYESYTLQVIPVQTKNIYKSNEKIAFQIILIDKAKRPVFGQKIGYAISSGDGKLQRNIITTTDGKPLFCETSLDKPGWVQVNAMLLNEDGKPILKNKKVIMAGAGAMVEPEKIKAGCEEPADFKKFWDDQKAILAKIPVKAERIEVPVERKYEGKFRCYDVKVACVDNVPVSGYLTIPVAERKQKYPAVVYYYGAGVASANKHMRNNAISFSVNAHGILNGQPNEYYKKLYANELYRYYLKNKDNRNKFYFKNMYLRAVRALD